MEFPGDGCFEILFEVRTVKARKLLETSGRVEKDNKERCALKPLYGLSTACKDWCKPIRDFLEKSAGEVTSLDKSVCFWTRQVFDYGYGGEFRGTDPPNLGKCILKANGNFGTTDKRKV